MRRDESFQRIAELPIPALVLLGDRPVRVIARMIMERENQIGHMDASGRRPA